ncbi:ROK family transcriptional regulator [Sulfoacidibacillus thermotolerans]|nr:ROK family protein [Sulfoacidibacillus thermotolerans]
MNIDASAMRLLNRASVLRYIRDHKLTTRIAISEATGLTRATVSSLVETLLEEGFVDEVGYGASSGGRKPVMLRFNADAAYSIGVDVQISHMTTVVCNIRGDIAYKNVRRLLNAQTGQKIDQLSLLEWIQTEVKAALAHVPPSPHGITGIGLAVPGLVNFTTGFIYHLPNLSISNWGIREVLQEQFALPVYVDNDANCGAFAEYEKRNVPKSSIIYVNAGIGVGVGLILNGQLFRGRDGLAGEFGHMTIEENGVPCSCGNRGCFEQYASEQSLMRYLEELQIHVSPSAEISSILEQVIYESYLGSEKYQFAFERLGTYLGIGMANIANALNPDEIVLGGRVSMAYKFLSERMISTFKQRAISQNREIPIVMGYVNGVAIGAAGIAMNESLFASPVASVG